MSGNLLPCPFCGGEAVKVDGFTVACAHGLCIGWTVRRASPHEWNTRALPAVQPKVKPLVWVSEGPWDKAVCSYGTYYIQYDDETQAWFASLELGEVESPIILSPSDVPNWGDAEAAAHADYEARILSALEPAVQPDMTDPIVVHANMLRGTIAKPTLDQIIHLYGVDALCRALVPAINREAALDEMSRLGQEFDAALKGESHD